MQKVYELIDLIPARNTFIHGDFHIIYKEKQRQKIESSKSVPVFLTAAKFIPKKEKN